MDGFDELANHGKTPLDLFVIMRRDVDLHSPILAATETAARYGLVCDRCEILQDGHTLVLKLSESLVARVVAHRDGPRSDMQWFARESAVATHLARMGAPVIPMHPAIPAGPHQHLGHTLNFWQFVNILDAKPESAETGRTLFHCHAVLRGFNDPLPALGILQETMELIEASSPCAQLNAEDIVMMKERLSDSIGALCSFPMQPLHGDAHGGNLICTTHGLLWTDWEDTFLGPVEWDLASIIWNARFIEKDSATAEAILSAYCEAGGSIDQQALHHSQIARAAVMSAWYPVLYPNPNPERLEKLRFRLDWLRNTE
jgi:hypothetical protein